jgi:tetratricopeptide (TPR) repeat protein
MNERESGAYMAKLVATVVIVSAHVLTINLPSGAQSGMPGLPLKLEESTPVAQNYLNQGNSFRDRKDFKNAITAYSSALRSLSSKSKERQILAARYSALSGRAGCYRALKDYKNALADCNEIIATAPHDLRALGYQDRASCYMEQKNYKSALPDWNAAAAGEGAIGLGFGACYLGRGKCYLALHENKKAISDFNKYVELNPDSEFAYKERARMYQSIGEQKSADADLIRSKSLSDAAEKSSIRGH